jgi:hypothetical protein
MAVFCFDVASGLSNSNFPSRTTVNHHHLLRLLPQWIMSFDLFRHRRVDAVSWDAHDLFFREVGS